MKISAKMDYACKALIELALQWPNRVPLQINAIASQQSIPIKFLPHILLNLKQMGFVQSVRGKNGGYVLNKPPREVTLREILTSMGDVSLRESSSPSNAGSARVLDEICSEIDTSVLQSMNEITLEAICNRIRNQQKTLMFDI